MFFCLLLELTELISECYEPLVLFISIEIDYHREIDIVLAYRNITKECTSRTNWAGPSRQAEEYESGTS